MDYGLDYEVVVQYAQRQCVLETNKQQQALLLGVNAYQMIMNCMCAGAVQKADTQARVTMHAMGKSMRSLTPVRGLPC